MRTLEILMRVLQVNDTKKQGLCFTDNDDERTFIGLWFGDGFLSKKLENNAWYLYYYGSELGRCKPDAVVILEDGEKVYLYRIEDK